MAHSRILGFILFGAYITIFTTWISHALVTPLIGIVYFYPTLSERLMLLGGATRRDEATKARRLEKP